MKIDIIKNGDSLTLGLNGRLDTTSAPELEAFLSSNLDGVSALVMDCGNLSYISSAGLRVLLATQKKMQGAMKLIHVQELVMEVFEMTGFADILVIE